MSREPDDNDQDAFAELMKYLGQDETTVPPLEDEPADEGAEEAPTEADCWGAQLTGRTSKCSPGFVLGKGHFKNKFCHACRMNGLAVPAARVRTVLSNCNLRNELRPGFWSGPSLKQNVVGSFRLINQTADCIGSPLLLTSDESAYPATSTYLDVVPSDIVDANNYVNLIVSKGTLVPVSRERMAANALARSGSGESAASSSPSKGSAAGKRTHAQLDVELEEDQRRKSPATIDEKEGAAGLHERVSLGGATAGSSVDSRASAAMTSSLDIALALREASTLHGAGGFVPLESRHRRISHDSFSSFRDDFSSFNSNSGASSGGHTPPEGRTPPSSSPPPSSAASSVSAQVTDSLTAACTISSPPRSTSPLYYAPPQRPAAQHPPPPGMPQQVLPLAVSSGYAGTAPALPPPSSADLQELMHHISQANHLTMRILGRPGAPLLPGGRPLVPEQQRILLSQAEGYQRSMGQIRSWLGDTAPSLSHAFGVAIGDSDAHAEGWDVARRGAGEPEAWETLGSSGGAHSNPPGLPPSRWPSVPPVAVPFFTASHGIQAPPALPTTAMPLPFPARQAAPPPFPYQTTTPSYSEAHELEPDVSSL